MSLGRGSLKAGGQTVFIEKEREGGRAICFYFYYFFLFGGGGVGRSSTQVSEWIRYAAEGDGNEIHASLCSAVHRQREKGGLRPLPCADPQCS